MLRSIALLLLLLWPMPKPLAQNPSPAPYVPPARVRALPVFFVSRGDADPTAEQKDNLTRHLAWSQRRYAELLRGVTFRVDAQGPVVYHAAHERAYYEAQPESSAPAFVAELLAQYKLTRYNCPYVFLVVFMNPDRDFPTGGGRSINGGYNTGGGVVVLSSRTRQVDFQSTLQHELGHSFGLPHVDTYGYSMMSNRSIMSYDPAHHTNEFEASRTPGELIPEDIRGLALNQRALAGASFQPARDVPAGYRIAPEPVVIGPMVLPGLSDGRIRVETVSSETFGSHANNVVQNRIRRDAPAGNGGVNFDPATMWQSAESATGWVSLTLSFPLQVRLDRIGVHSEHSGKYHRAEAIRVETADGDPRPLKEAELAGPDAVVDFPAATAQRWKLSFKAGTSRAVVLRGLQFFLGGSELFPPMIPYAP